MIPLFLDTDILLDFLGDRKPFSKFALQIFINANKRNFRLYVSGYSITTAYYILCKYADEKRARELISGLLDYVSVIPVTARVLRSAFKSEFKDVEDAVQHFCALSESKIKHLVTRNLKDYKKSQINVFTPEEILGLIIK